MSNDSANVLTKWRRFFMYWQLGDRPKGDPEADAVVDHREVTMLLRAEVSALVGLLVQKKVFTATEYTAMMHVECEQLSEDYGKRFPGISATDIGITYKLPDAQHTLVHYGILRHRT